MMYGILIFGGVLLMIIVPLGLVALLASGSIGAVYFFSIMFSAIIVSGAVGDRIRHYDENS